MRATAMALRCERPWTGFELFDHLGDVRPCCWGKVTCGNINEQTPEQIWNGTGLLHAGKIDLERCTGPAGNQNRTGIAAWIHGPVGSDPIVLPGDAGYADVPGLARGAVISSLVVAHHGGHAPGTPPLKPGVGTPRAAFSYGCPNGYNHPLPGSLSRLTASKWTIGHPAAGVDERRTEDRPGGKGGSGLGHIRMNWTGNTGPVHACSCGCTLNPTQ